MDGQLLVRLYNVGLGDCIYLRVPDLEKEVHILIDCGNKFDELQILKDHITELKKELPDAGNNQKRLDLLVVTHPHEDHHKGFEEEIFGGLKIGRIWLSPAFDRLNPKAKGFQALQDAAKRGLQELAKTGFGDIKEEAAELLSLSKDEAIDMLCNRLPVLNGIKVLYVTANTHQELLKIFDDPKIQLKILGPMGDIDNYYLGGDGLLNTAGGTTSQGMAEGFGLMFQPPNSEEITPPRNISAQDFKQLQSHIRPNALAAAEVAGHAVNNLSVVMLLDWRGRRLLFTGDAEWSGKDDIGMKKGKSNCSWNVMWQERKDDLSKPVDFLKIGHHGSVNATPWTPPRKNGEDYAISQILDKLLPPPQEGQRPTARAVASTKRTERWPSIPNAELLEEIGRRVANSRTEYVEVSKSEKIVPPKNTQPQRTDLEDQVMKKAVPFIELLFDSKE